MRRAIVTGGTRGVGFAIAKAIVASGGKVLITGLDRGRLERAVEALATGGDRSQIAGAAVDVRDRQAVDALVADAASRFGGLDTLINNAAAGLHREVAATSDADWHRIIDTNLTGVFYATRAAIPALRESGDGWIVNIASLAGRHFFAGGAAYCASKAALIAFTEVVMQELRFDNIRATVILPGSIATEFTGPVEGDDSWKLAPEDVAETVMGLFQYPPRSLPSHIEIRPARPKRG